MFINSQHVHTRKRVYSLVFSSVFQGSITLLITPALYLLCTKSFFAKYSTKCWSPKKSFLFFLFICCNFQFGFFHCKCSQLLLFCFLYLFLDSFNINFCFSRSYVKERVKKRDSVIHSVFLSIHWKLTTKQAHICIP